MLLDSHGGGVGGPGEVEYIQPVEEDHQDWEDGGASLRSVCRKRVTVSSLQDL